MIKGVGRDTGGRGNASAEITAQAESLSPTSTKVVVTTDLHITGKVAQFGRGHHGRRQLQADGAVRQQPERDARRAGPRRRPRLPPTRPPTGRPSADASTAAGTDGRGTTRPADTAERSSRPRPTSQVRKINGPATEPIDLMEVGGSSILKRAVPAVVALVARAVPPSPPPGLMDDRGAGRPNYSDARRAVSFEVVVRDDAGDPVVVRNAPVPRRRHPDAHPLLPRRTRPRA